MILCLKNEIAYISKYRIGALSLGGGDTSLGNISWVGGDTNPDILNKKLSAVFYQLLGISFIKANIMLSEKFVVSCSLDSSSNFSTVTDRKLVP